MGRRARLGTRHSPTRVPPRLLCAGIHISVNLLPSSTGFVFPPPVRGFSCSALHAVVCGTTMASADFWPPIPRSRDRRSTWQVTRPPRVRRAMLFGASLQGLRANSLLANLSHLYPPHITPAVSVQVSGFEDMGLLTHGDCLVCDSCYSLHPWGSPLWGLPAAIQNCSRQFCRRASALPSASFRFHLSMDTLAVRLTVPLAGPAGDFHPQVFPSPPQLGE